MGPKASREPTTHAPAGAERPAPALPVRPLPVRPGRSALWAERSALGPTAGNAPRPLPRPGARPGSCAGRPGRPALASRLADGPSPGPPALPVRPPWQLRGTPLPCPFARPGSCATPRPALASRPGRPALACRPPRAPQPAAPPAFSLQRCAHGPLADGPSPPWRHAPYLAPSPGNPRPLPSTCLATSPGNPRPLPGALASYGAELPRPASFAAHAAPPLALPAARAWGPHPPPRPGKPVGRAKRAPGPPAFPPWRDAPCRPAEPRSLRPLGPKAPPRQALPAPCLCPAPAPGPLPPPRQALPLSLGLCPRPGKPSRALPQGGGPPRPSAWASAPRPLPSRPLPQGGSCATPSPWPGQAQLRSPLCPAPARLAGALPSRLAPQPEAPGPRSAASYPRPGAALPRPLPSPTAWPGARRRVMGQARRARCDGAGGRGPGPSATGPAAGHGGKGARCDGGPRFK